MSRYSDNTRERDDQGRFTSSDERGYSRGGPDRGDNGRFMSEGGRRSTERGRDDEGRFTSDYGSSRGRFQGDDQHYGPRSLGSMGRDRDEEGRFTSEYGSRSRGRYDEDYRYRGRPTGRDRDDEGRFTRRGGSSEGRGTGGWFGDSEGHSEASRRGWESGSHGDSGWYGDSEGHSEASRRGWDNPRHGESGWYGDSEGHSEASRRGWEGREGGRSPRYEERSQRYDEMQSRSRSRSDDDRDYRRSDDYDRGNGGRGQGWSGDPEGHSEASRRGWQNRRLLTSRQQSRSGTAKRKLGRFLKQIWRMIHDPRTCGLGRERYASSARELIFPRPSTTSSCELETKAPARTLLEVLESFPEDAEFESLADVVTACGGSDQVPQTGIIDVKP